MLLSSYLFLFFQSENFRIQREAIVSGAAQPQLPIRSLNEAVIPLPPLATQRAIVAEIEAEQALVASNRELIARFEKKIQATLARVWGEEESGVVAISSSAPKVRPQAPPPPVADEEEELEEPEEEAPEAEEEESRGGRRRHPSRAYSTDAS